MTGNTKLDDARPALPLRLIGWSVPALILLLPLIGGWPWTLSDFVVMGVLLGGAGLVLELIVRASRDIAYRAGAAVAVLASVLLIWVNLAVGFLGGEDNPANLMFLGVIAIAALGAVFAGPRPQGMARAMFAAGAAQILAGAIGFGAGLGSPGFAGLYEAVMGTIVFGALWFVAAGLFRKAAAREAGDISQ